MKLTVLILHNRQYWPDNIIIMKGVVQGPPFNIMAYLRLRVCVLSTAKFI